MSKDICDQPKSFSKSSWTFWLIRSRHGLHAKGVEDSKEDCDHLSVVTLYCMRLEQLGNIHAALRDHYVRFEGTV